MRNRTILMSAAAAAILAGPAMAQVAGVGSTTDVDVGATVETPPVSDTVDTVQDTTDTAIDTVQDTVNTATDTAADAADRATDAVPDATVEAAAEADIKAGAEVRDTDGNKVGTIESVDASGAVIATGEARVQLPVSSFGKNDRGLVIAMSKTELEAAAKAAADPT